MLATTSEGAAILIFVLCVGAIAFRVVMYTRWEQRNNPRQYDRVNHGDWAPTSDTGPMITEQPTSSGRPGGADSLSFADLRAHPAGSADPGPVPPPPPPDIPYDESWSSDPEPVIRTRPARHSDLLEVGHRVRRRQRGDVRVPDVRDADPNRRPHGPVLLHVHGHPGVCDGHDASGVGNEVGRQSVAAAERVLARPLSVWTERGQ